jgi:hypothetical protein
VSYAIATSTSEVRGVIEPAVEAVWTALGYAADTIEWPNTYFTKPGNGAWVRVTFPQQSTTAYTWSAGVVQNTTIGILSIQVFAPKNAGSALLIAAGDAFRAAFERKSLGDGIRFREALGPNDTALEAQWGGIQFSFAFEFIEDITQ